LRICIVGAGAIGGYLGAKLALAGEEVTLIARGAHLEAIQRNGLILQMGDGTTENAKPALATNNMKKAGLQDVVIVAVKSHSLPSMAPAIRALYGPDTVVITAQNGIPWWYFHNHGGPHEGRRIESVDPNGVIEAHLEIDRVIGCVVYPATELAGPGIVRHIEGNRFSLGELDGSKSERIRVLSHIFSKAGLKAPVRTQIRDEIWVKLWGNLAFNPISALTGATLVDMCQHPLVRELARNMMVEAQTIAKKLGIKSGISIDQRIKGAEEVGAHKTSMLQDLESGRPLEIDALLGSVAELGKMTQTPTPHLDSIYACVKLLTSENSTKPEPISIT
jgi:2-dehydropantoate 2-reductase